VISEYFPALASLAAALVVAMSAASAQPRSGDPDWPCQQRLVPKLAAAAYWSGPTLEGIGDWHADPEIAALVQRLAPRQVSTQEGLSQITSFVQALSQDRPRRIALTFQGLLEETDQGRTALIQRLKEIGRRQRELAELVAELSEELRSIPSEATGDAAVKRVDLQQRRDFTARNFEAIQRTIRYACETPVELDARLGAWARALQEAASE
jgi:hypothetical protein